MSRLKEKFINESAKLGIKLGTTEIEKFFVYLEEILSQNKKFSLTAYKTAGDILQFLFLDSLTCFKTSCFKQKGVRLIDIGTGCGIPGIPLKITRPDLKIFLLESAQKKVKFLEEIILKLGLKETKVLNERAEILAQNKDFREVFDLATARAVAPLRVLLEYGLPFLKLNGRLIAQKGKKAETEIKESERALEILGGEIENIMEFTFFGQERSLVVVKKVDFTPEKHPRRAGIPSKKPL